MVCSVCYSQEDKLRSMPNISMTFINGSTNFRLSSLKDDDSSECHQRATREKEHEGAVAAGISLAPRKVIQQTPSNSAIKQCFQHMGELEKESVQKLHEIAYYIASKGQAFTDFKDHIEVVKLHEVKYSGAYENESDFIFSISELRAMDRLVEKFGLYAQHLQNVISTSLNKVDKSTLEGKFAKLVDATVLVVLFS